jgi:hypothetical protein
MIYSRKGCVIIVCQQLHMGMVHTIAQLALLFNRLLCRVMAIVAISGVCCFDNVMLVGKYHILPCYETEHQRPGAKYMVGTSFQNKLLLNYMAKVINKCLNIFLKRNNVVNWM